MGFSIWHLIIIVFIVLLLFGPNRLPSLGKSVGEAIRGFKKGLNEDEIDVTSTVRSEQIRANEKHTADAKTESEKNSEKNKV